MIIYKCTNIINDKIYIGKTSKTLEWRMKIHKQSSSYDDSLFYRAIRKYGFEKFKWEIIKTCKNEKV